VSYLLASRESAAPNCRCACGNALTRARELYERYHCFPGERLVHQTCRREIPRVLVGLGELCGVIYRSDRGQCGRPRKFVHFFDQPPRLACDASGRQLYVLGGSYQVTRRGIEG
jgi:hypothetical protein